jgi:orotate phosphoribosyltransferase
VDALKKEKCTVKGVAAIFNYKLKVSDENFKKAKLTCVSLCDFPTLIERAAETNYIVEKDLKTLEDWMKNPEGWKK